MSMTSRSFAVFVFTLFFGLFSVSQAVEAKRFGGGKSFGFQKKVAPKNHNQAKQSKAPEQGQKPLAGQAKPASGASKWLGPLAGLAAGGLLAAMIFGDGFEGIQIMDILLFALIAFILFKLFAGRARQTGAHQNANASHQAYEPSPQQADHVEPVQQRQSTQPSYDPTAQSGSIFGADLKEGIGQGLSEDAQFFKEVPDWFDSEQFVEGAKQHFINLQKAWDNVNLAEIESYCTPELYQAIERELVGVQPGDNETRVDSLDAEIAAMAVDGEFFIVSIRFSGFIEEDAHGAHAFNEVWHIRRLANDQGNWMVAGIQQTNALA